ncbi:unknown [Choristoneura occidentalis granulovirus]|uniref:Uncharacterized protein n=1 Tax=Choristoneura occidentalis granulovirus TaxID=364745 RepID=Q1A4L1_9BBAC|nr:unknown [Choristoneura fumiferana granulovirus]ABC61219.1 unknown [Choristoneura fumiferana granulovirus]
MNKKIKLDFSLLYNNNVEPIPLKLSNNSADLKNSNVTTEADATFSMWLIIVSWVFILVVIFLVSYYIISYVNGEFNDEEDYGEL